jgi:hypothetical protein
VLHVLMLHEIGEVDRDDIVAVDKGGECKGAVKLMKKLTELGSLGHVITKAQYSASTLKRETTSYPFED